MARQKAKLKHADRWRQYGTERKKYALKRLEEEGRLEQFMERKAQIKRECAQNAKKIKKANPDAVYTWNKDLFFYSALAEFPPIGENQNGTPVGDVAISDAKPASKPASRSAKKPTAKSATKPARKPRNTKDKEHPAIKEEGKREAAQGAEDECVQRIEEKSSEERVSVNDSVEAGPTAVCPT